MILLLLLACATEPTKTQPPVCPDDTATHDTESDTDTDSDSDTDADTDSDSDADADTDSDTDSDTDADTGVQACAPTDGLGGLLDEEISAVVSGSGSGYWSVSWELVSGEITACDAWCSATWARAWYATTGDGGCEGEHSDPEFALEDGYHKLCMYTEWPGHSDTGACYYETSVGIWRLDVEVR